MMTLTASNSFTFFNYCFIHLKKYSDLKIEKQKKISHTIAYYRQLLNSFKDGLIVLDKHFQVIDANQQQADMLGYSLEELIGMSPWQWNTELNKTDICEKFVDFEKANTTFETCHRRKDGQLNYVEVSIRGTVFKKEPLLIVLTRDISERKKSQQQLLDSIERYKAIIKTAKDGFLVINTHGKIIEANDAYCSMVGFEKQEVIGKTISDFEVIETQKETQKHIEQIKKKTNTQFESKHLHKKGYIIPVEVSVSYADVEGGCVFGFIRNIEERKITERILDMKEKLTELLSIEDYEELMRFALDTAEKLTGSQIGFFHFVEEDQETVSLQVWSTRTLKEMCFVKGEGLHYPISQAGVWVDCIYQKQPIIHNDYASLPHKKGMPEGHTKLLRELTVPVFRNEKIVAVIGVGNKQENYDERDLEIVNQISDIAIDFVQRKQAEQKIEFMAFYDALTGLPNRELLADRLNQAISLTKRSNLLLAICYMDLDGFKPVNDKYGHHTGDKLLIKIAKRLQTTLREGDTMARLGGDEFVILLNGLLNIHDAEEIVLRLLETIKQPFDIDEHRIYVSGSIGVTLFPTDRSDADTLIRHADQAMYQAKSEGKSTYKLFEPVQNQELKAHQKILHEFETALHNGEIVLYYQPKVDIRSKKLISVEALIRWVHPEKGFLPPNLFLSQLENTPQEILLDEWVIKTALNQHLNWRNAGLIIPVSVNITPRHIHSDAFYDFLQQTLAQYPKEISNYLEIEILETAAIQDSRKVAEVMHACNKLGIKFSLDDFGTGYASLAYFYQLPIEILKLDQNFVKDMLDDANDLAIVEGVIHLAKALNRPLIAEGVETIEHALLLLQLGCHFIQGYGVAKPMPAEQVFNWHHNWQKNPLWQQLPKAIDGNLQNYDLNVVIFNHQYWLKQLMTSFNPNEVKAQLSFLKDRQAMFNRWFKGIGNSRYGSHPTYAFLASKHQIIVQTAESIINAQQDLQTNELETLSTQLETLNQEFITLLKKIAREY